MNKILNEDDDEEMLKQMIERASKKNSNKLSFEEFYQVMMRTVEWFPFHLPFDSILIYIHQSCNKMHEMISYRLHQTITRIWYCSSPPSSCSPHRSCTYLLVFSTVPSGVPRQEWKRYTHFQMTHVINFSSSQEKYLAVKNGLSAHSGFVEGNFSIEIVV